MQAVPFFVDENYARNDDELYQKLSKHNLAKPI